MKTIPIIPINDDTATYELIKNKIIDHAEIVVGFFDYCNMKCVFCPQDHTNKTGTSKVEILSKVTFVLEYIHNNSHTTEFLVHLMGGELFQDDLIENGMLDHYSEFIFELEKNKKDKILNYNITTNLVFSNTQPVIDFCKKHNLKLSASYDSHGRFTDSQLTTFKKNIDIFKPYIKLISGVLTVQNIRKIISGDSYFDYLYEHFDCYWDHLLISNKKYEFLLPTESDLLKFYIHLVDYYPNTVNTQQFFNKDYKTNKMSCTRGNSFTVLYDNSIPAGCSSSVLMNSNSENTKTADLGTTKIIDNFLNENDCLSCEYYSRCNLSCFVNNDYKHLVKDVTKCVFKEVFKYVKSKQ